MAQETMNSIRVAVLLFAVALAAPLVEAKAGSAIVYGNKTINTITANTAMEAASTAMARCSRTDTNCKVLIQCDTRGFGYVAASMNGGLVEGIGAACGRADAASAQEIAFAQCKANTKWGSCALRNSWVDRQD